MCVVSAVGDNYRDRFTQQWPNWDKYVSTYEAPAVTKEEFEALKAEVEELKKVLKAAKLFDEATGQANCEMDDKVELIKRLAETLGVDLEDLFE